MYKYSACHYYCGAEARKCYMCWNSKISSSTQLLDQQLPCPLLHPQGCVILNNVLPGNFHAISQYQNRKTPTSVFPLCSFFWCYVHVDCFAKVGISLCFSLLGTEWNARIRNSFGRRDWSVNSNDCALMSNFSVISVPLTLLVTGWKKDISRLCRMKKSSLKYSLAN